MATDTLQQIRNLLDTAGNILIISHASIDGDGLGSGLGLQMALTKLGKKVTFYSRNPVPEVFRFLPGVQGISSEFSLNKDFIIEIDTTQTKIDQVRTNEEGTKLHIIVTPQNGTLNKEDIKFLSGGKKFDLIFTLDTSNLEYTGLTNGPQAELFYETPIINIDHHITNEQYGKVNFVDINATSTAELVLQLIENLEEKMPLMDADMATCLLSGVIVDTGSFQNANTTPKAFEVAAKLLAAGARQQEIIKYLFKMHELSTLRLWGKTLSKLQHDPELHLAWATVTQEDFAGANATEEELEGLMDQLITSASDADIVFLIKEQKDGVIRVSMRSIKNIDITPIVLPFGGGGHPRAAGFRVTGKPILEAEQIVLEAVRGFMKDYLARTNAEAPASHPVHSTIKSEVPPATVPAPVATPISSPLPSPLPSSPTSPIPNSPEGTPLGPSPTPMSDNIPPSGMSNKQTEALKTSYTEKKATLPKEFLGYTPVAPKEQSLLEEKNVMTPQEKEAQQFVQNNPQPTITLKVTKD